MLCCFAVLLHAASHALTLEHHQTTLSHGKAAPMQTLTRHDALDALMLSSLLYNRVFLTLRCA
jgi:hypothetical protein